MAERKVNKIIEAMRAEGKTPYSISRINTIDQCLAQAKYTYVDKIKGENSIYGHLGTAVHDALEDIYIGKTIKGVQIERERLIQGLKKALAEAEILGLSFPKDFKGGNAIGDSWEGDMFHFAKNHKKIQGNPADFITEKFVSYKLPNGEYMIGYVDLIHIINRKKKIIDVYDFKTSSDFKKEDLRHHGRQLIFYGLALESEGYTVRNLAWIMLKYVKISYIGKARANSKQETPISVIEHRGKIGKKLAKHVESKLMQMGFSDIDSELIIDELINDNDITKLPTPLNSEIKIEQYIRTYPFSKENKEETINYVVTNIDRFNKAVANNEWPPLHIDKSNSFFCNVLCSHRSSCPHIAQYNNWLKLNEAADEELF